MVTFQTSPIPLGYETHDTSYEMVISEPKLRPEPLSSRFSKAHMDRLLIIKMKIIVLN